MNRIDKIFVFGMESCQFCKDQLQGLQDSFALNKICYLDLLKDNDALSIAEEFKLEFTPATIILSGDKVVSKRNGLCPVDELFYSVNNTVPIDKESFSKLNSEGRLSILLSFKPTGKTITLETYDQNSSIKASIININKIGSSEIKKIFGNKIFRKYSRMSGNKTEAFLLNLGEEIDGFA